MKCDELKPLVFSISDLAYVDEPTPQPNFQDPHDHAVYKATEVDALLAKKDKEIESLKASHYAEMVDAGMRERRLRRALWLKRADDAKHLVVTYENYDYLEDVAPEEDDYDSEENAMTCKLRTAEEWVKVWKNVERKCRAKAEEYKEADQ